MTNKLTLTFLTLLVCSNFIVGMYLRDNLYTIVWNGGDVSYIGIAREFQEHKDLKIPYLTQDQLSSSLNETLKNYPDISFQEGGKGPIYLMSLGTFFDLLGTTPPNFYFHASLFANITTSAFLVVFFFFIKSKFNQQIAVVSSIVLAFLPFFAWTSVRVLPDAGIFLTLSIAAFFFLEKKIKHYVLFGFFTGLSHLTHEFGVLLGTSYTIFLLINREFKGALLVFVSWTITLLPWMMRNYYYFKNVGVGLYLPFGTKISGFVSNIFHTGPLTDSYHVINQSVSHFIGTFTPFNVFTESFFQELMHQYYMGYLIIFFILFSGFAFLSIEKLHFKKFIYLAPVGLAYYLVNSYVHNIYVQSVFLFVLPVILVYLFYKKGKLTFMEHIPRTYSFIIWFVFICLAAFFYTALTFLREVPETRQLMLPFYLLIPVSMVGFYNVISFIVNKKIKIEQKPRHFSFSTLGINIHISFNGVTKNKDDNIVTKRNTKSYLIIAIFVLALSPIMLQEVSGIQFLNHFVLKVFDQKSWFDNSLNNWLQTNIHNGVIASDVPSQLFLMTGLSTIPLPPLSWGQIQFEQYLVNYNATYIIFYDEDRFLSSDTYKAINQWPEWYFSYDEVYTIYNHAHVIKLTNLVSNADISDPVHYIRKADLLQRLGKPEEANQIYDELKDFKPTSMQQMQGLCNAYTVDEKFVDAISSCNKLLFIDKNNLMAMYNLIISYAKTTQKEKMTETLQNFYSAANVNSQNPESLYLWIDFMNKQIPHNIHTTNSHDVDISLVYNQYSSIMKPYDEIIKLLQNDINDESDQLKKQILLLILIDTLENRGTKLMNLSDYADAEKTYQEILRLDQFNIDAHEKYATILEKTDRLQEAVYQYEFLSKIENNNTKILEKIHELKTKLISQ